MIVPPRAMAVPGGTAEAESTRCDRHLRGIAEPGRMGRRKRSGYTERVRAETAIARREQVIGDGPRSRTHGHRASETDVAVHALDRMPEFGRPSHVRTA